MVLIGVVGVGEIADTFFFFVSADTLFCKVSSLQMTFLGLPLGSIYEIGRLKGNLLSKVYVTFTT